MPQAACTPADREVCKAGGRGDEPGGALHLDSPGRTPDSSESTPGSLERSYRNLQPGSPQDISVGMAVQACRGVWH